MHTRSPGKAGARYIPGCTWRSCNPMATPPSKSRAVGAWTVLVGMRQFAGIDLASRQAVTPVRTRRTRLCTSVAAFGAI